MSVPRSPSGRNRRRSILSSTELSATGSSSTDASAACLSHDELARHVVRLERRLTRETTARHEAERIAEDGMRKLYSANVDLDRRISERTAELDDARHQAEAASRVKTDLLNCLSHEMRTPMNGILGSLELLEDSVADGEERELLQTASKSALRMNRLVIRLLKAIALESADFTGQLVPVPVDSLLASVRGYWASRGLRAGKLLIVKNELVEGAQIATYGDYLRDACDELIRNTIDHAHGGAVNIVADELESENGVFVRLSVADTGPGIAAEELAMLRQPLFARDSDKWPQNGGLGLGLGLVDRLCEALGGSWNIESSPSGTTVAILMPTVP